jgi:hypothetical protein
VVGESATASYSEASALHLKYELLQLYVASDPNTETVTKLSLKPAQNRQKSAN